MVVIKVIPSSNILIGSTWSWRHSAKFGPGKGQKQIWKDTTGLNIPSSQLTSKKLNVISATICIKISVVFCNINKDRAHFGVRFSCPACEHKATTSGNLKVHIRSVHEKVKSPCNQCDYQAYDNTSLTKHNNAVHMNLKPYTCNLCPTTFSIKSYLTAHIKRVHKVKWQSLKSYSQFDGLHDSLPDHWTLT